MVDWNRERFEWDEDKNDDNESKHGIAFEEILEVFDDFYAFVKIDVAHSSFDEIRYILIGESPIGFVIVIFTERGGKFRIISARMANAKDRRIYEKQKKNKK